MELLMKMVQVPTKKNQSIVMCEHAIKCVTPYHHTIIAGSHMVFAPNMWKHHIMNLIEGTAVFQLEDKDYRFDEFQGIGKDV